MARWRAWQGLIALVLLLGCATAKRATREDLNQWLRDGTAYTVQETTTWDWNQVLDRPACLVLHATGPAHSQSSINFQLAAPPQLAQCLSRAVSWKTYVYDGGDMSPPDVLASAQGYTGSLASSWEASVVLSSAGQLDSSSSPDLPQVNGADIPLDDTPTPTPSSSSSSPGQQQQQAPVAGAAAAGATSPTTTTTASGGPLAPRMVSGAGKTFGCYADSLGALSDVTTRTAKGGGLDQLNTCINNIPATAPAVTPLRPTPQGSSVVVEGLDLLRRLIGVEPRKVSPQHIGNHNPYGSLVNPDQPQSSMTVRNQVYQLNPERCAVAFQDTQGFSLSASSSSGPSSQLVGTPKRYNSCYVTTTLIYIFYDGTCSNASAINPGRAGQPETQQLSSGSSGTPAATTTPTTTTPATATTGGGSTHSGAATGTGSGAGTTGAPGGAGGGTGGDPAAGNAAGGQPGTGNGSGGSGGGGSGSRGTLPAGGSAAAGSNADNRPGLNNPNRNPSNNPNTGPNSNPIGNTFNNPGNNPGNSNNLGPRNTNAAQRAGRGSFDSGSNKFDNSNNNFDNGPFNDGQSGPGMPFDNGNNRFNGIPGQPRSGLRSGQPVDFGFFDNSFDPNRGFDMPMGRPANRRLAQQASGTPQPQQAAPPSSSSSGLVASVSVSYTPYTGCHEAPIFKMNEVQQLTALALGAPTCLFLLLLTLPTLWRLVYQPFVYLAMWWTPRRKNGYNKWQHMMQLKMDSPARWSWWVWLQPKCAAPLGWRKHLVYAVTTVSSTNGYSRMLQVSVFALCCVSVTIIVWQPEVKTWLHKNPSIIEFQLSQQPGGPLGGFITYAKIMGISLFEGCVAYLTLLANLNKPRGNHYWVTQVVISAVFSAVLLALLTMQWLNLILYITVIEDPAPYLWLIAAQGWNIISVLVLQIYSLIKLSRQRNGNTYSALVSYPAGGGGGGGSGGKGTGHGNGHHHHHHISSSKVMGEGPLEGLRVIVEIDDGMDEHEVAHMDSLSRKQDKAAMVHGPRPTTAAGKPLSWRQRCWWYVQHAYGEEHIDIPLGNGTNGHRLSSNGYGIMHNTSSSSTTVRARRVCVFAYPAWFLAASMVASTLLTFHYMRALTWADRWGDCIVTPDTCRVKLVRQWSSLLASDQLTVVQAGLLSIREGFRGLAASSATLPAVLNEALQATGSKTLTQVDVTLLTIVDVLTPGKLYDDVAQYKTDFLHRLQELSFVGFFIGTTVAWLSLMHAFKTYKSIVKRHRKIKLLNRLRDDGGDPAAIAVDGLAAAAQCRAESRLPSQSGNGHGGPPNGHPTFMVVGSSSSGSRGARGEAQDQESDAYSITYIAAVRALSAPISTVVFFIGVLLASVVFQFYVVGILSSIALAFLTEPLFWQHVLAWAWPYLLVAVLLIIVNKVVVEEWIGNTYVSDGTTIRRPAGWIAFMIIGSITNLLFGLLLAVLRLVLLFFTTLFAIGMLDRTLLAISASWDLPYNSFLAGVHLQTTNADLGDPAKAPGARGRAVRRWRAAKDAVVQLGQEGFDELLEQRLAHEGAKALLATATRSAPAQAKGPKLPPRDTKKSDDHEPSSQMFSNPRDLRPPVSRGAAELPTPKGGYHPTLSSSPLHHHPYHHTGAGVAAADSLQATASGRHSPSAGATTQRSSSYRRSESRRKSSASRAAQQQQQGAGGAAAASGSGSLLQHQHLLEGASSSGSVSPRSTNI